MTVRLKRQKSTLYTEISRTIPKMLKLCRSTELYDMFNQTINIEIYA